MKKDSLSISYSELMKTLDEFRGNSWAKRVLTKEQMNFIEKSREHKTPISYKIMAELWEKVGWGKVSETTMRNIYLRDYKGMKV